MSEPRDVLARAIRLYRVQQRPEIEHFAEGTLDHLYHGDANAGLAALREHGFAVVRTVDVEAKTCAGCLHWVQRKSYGRCAHLGCAWGEDSPNAHGLSFSCAAWEAIR